MTKAINSYVTLGEFLKWLTPQDTSADGVDDAVIESILEAVSRHIDAETGRYFYPFVETRYYDTPYGREIELDEDLLEVIAVSNADGTAVTSYNLIPKNTSPHHGIRLTKASTVAWTTNATDLDEFSIDVNGIWGYHNNYSRRAWKSVGTLGAAITDTTTKAFTMAANPTIKPGTICKIENELYIIETVSGTTVTPKARGENGSTAATHANATAVYEFIPMPDISLACKLITQSIHRRFGKQASTQDENIVLGSGVVITPRDIPLVAKQAIDRNRRIY